MISGELCDTEDWSAPENSAFYCIFGQIKETSFKKKTYPLLKGGVRHNV